jgi:hypothetical protein
MRLLNPQEAMDETFYLSNIAPQVGVGFNRHCTRFPTQPFCRDAWLLLDWAYLEDWCRRLTKNFQDVYVFTVPLYLPKQDPDGKWRVVRIERPLYSLDHWLINVIDSWSHWFASQHICSNSLCQSSFGHKTFLSVFTWQTGTIFRGLCTTQCSHLWRSTLN